SSLDCPPPIEAQFMCLKSSGIGPAKALLLTINCSAFDEQKQCFSTPNSTAFESPILRSSKRPIKRH
ncbi:MAG: hypothetical protein IKT85_06625, partial [Kiritimatiellae bacterium]|nr:hypothetical protein [Kiritimatiellia bacterium]